MQLSIIIVNYNVKYFLEHCLRSVLKACEGLQAAILVVDNNSTDGSEEYLKDKFPDVKFFWNKTNPGFGKANNSVLNIAKGDYILFLNPDTIVPEDCFTNCISFFKQHQNCGALGVRMIDGAGNFLKESKRSLPKPSTGFYKLTGLAKLFPNSFFAGYYSNKVDEYGIGKVEVLAGAFMMISKKAIEKTCGFDEDFFMYGEDVDLSYRITKAGFDNYYNGEITILHFKGESTGKLSSDYIEHFYGAMKRFVDKHYNQNVIGNAVLKLSISAGKRFAAKKQKRQIVIEEDILQTAKEIIVVGDKTDVEKANQILNKSQYASTQTIFLNEIADVNFTLSKLLIDEKCAIVLCEGKFLPNKIIINILQKMKPSQFAFIYESGADSIIGSNDKNRNGISISNH